MLLLFNSYWHSSIAFSPRCFSPGTTNLDNRKLFVASAIWARRTWGKKLRFTVQGSVVCGRSAYHSHQIEYIAYYVRLHIIQQTAIFGALKMKCFFGVAQFFPFLCQLNFPTNFSFFVERQRKIFFALVAKKIATLIALKFSIDFQMIISSELFFSFEVFTCEQSSSFLLPIRVKRSTNKVAELH